MLKTSLSYHLFNKTTPSLTIINTTLLTQNTFYSIKYQLIKKNKMSINGHIIEVLLH